MKTNREKNISYSSENGRRRKATGKSSWVPPVFDSGNWTMFNPLLKIACWWGQQSPISKHVKVESSNQIAAYPQELKNPCVCGSQHDAAPCTCCDIQRPRENTAKTWKKHNKIVAKSISHQRTPGLKLLLVGRGIESETRGF